MSLENFISRLRHIFHFSSPERTTKILKYRFEKKKNPIFLPAVLILALLIFGLLMVYDSSSAQAMINFHDKYFFLKEQFKWVIVGLAAGCAGYLFDYRQFKHLALPILIVTLILLVAVFIPGISIKAYGAHRWLNFGLFVLQPSELAKLSLIIYLSAWFSTKEKGRLVSFLLLITLSVGLIMLEPDMGTALVILGTAVIIYFLSDNDIKGLLFLLPIGLAAITALAVFSPYRLRRVTSFLDPQSDPLGASYHVRQALIALGSGGLLGIGLGNSRQKYSYLPEANTDSIFAIIGEELGFIGAILFILVIVYLYFRLLKTTMLVEDKFGKYLALGIISWLTVQTVINLSSMVALTPLTGVPLPFISYGGSALVVELMGIGIIFNIWRENLK